MSPSAVRSLERLERRKVPFDRLISPELAKSLAEFSHGTGRQLGVLVDRAGRISWAVVGNAHRLMLPDVGRLRGAIGRLRGLRLLHTHLHNEPLSRDDLVDLTRLRLDLICAICLSPEGRPQVVYYAHNLPPSEHDDEGEPFQRYGPIPWGHLEVNPEKIVLGLEAEFARASRRRSNRAKDGRAILLHICEKNQAEHAQRSLQELHELARTAGVEVVDTVLQFRDRVDPKYVMGRGKIEDVVVRAMQLDAEVLLFDRNLSPGQASAIARMTDLKVLDRTQLILDVFAQRAQSKAGKLQIELAQMHYLLPRLGQRDDALSRLTGGIGGRGPGETKLEIGKRRARERIDRLKAEQRRLAGRRTEQRKRIKRQRVPSLAIIGYTNAGKSTLLNTLTGSEVLAENKLFATLDTRTRRLWVKDKLEVVVSDTVGFIRELPKELFPAFRATFEEAQAADLLLHLVDVSDEFNRDQLATTEQLLLDLDLIDVPRIVLWNKVDLANPLDVSRCLERYGGIAISATDPSSVQKLLDEVGQRLGQSSSSDPSLDGEVVTGTMPSS